MDLFERVSADIKAAMLAKDKVRLETLRGIKKEFLEAKTAKGADGELSDDTAIRIMTKMAKQRRETAEIYSSQNRPELAQNELAEAPLRQRRWARLWEWLRKRSPAELTAKPYLQK